MTWRDAFFLLLACFVGIGAAVGGGTILLTSNAYIGVKYTPVADPRDCTDNANRGFTWVDTDFHLKECVGTVLCPTTGVYDYVVGCEV